MAIHRALVQLVWAAALFTGCVDPTSPPIEDSDGVMIDGSSEIDDPMTPDENSIVRQIGDHSGGDPSEVELGSSVVYAASICDGIPCKLGLENKKELGPSKWVKVITSWGYQGGNVKWRRSKIDVNAPFNFEVMNWMNTPETGCNSHNGYSHHNCLTRLNVRYVYNGYRYRFCIHTRIYGNGNHSRLITDSACPNT